jgi:branched-chain amino acid transport system substrate-binding protein
MAAACALGLVVAACSEDSDGGGSAETTAAPAEETTAAPATTEAPAEETTTSAAPADDNAERDQVGLDYVGAAEVSEASGDPLVIGYVNQEGATPAFPENTVGLEAAVDYINSTLGGVQGRPVEIKTCVVQKEEDGQKCGQEMLADENVEYVLTGTLVLGNQPLYDTLAGQKPVFIGNPVTTPDFLAKDAFAFTPGSPGVIQGMAIFASTMLPEGNPTKAAVVYSDNAAGQAAYNLLTKPILEANGVAVTGVPIPDTAGPQDFAPAIQAAGAQDAGVFIPLVTIQGCIGTYDALKQLGITTPVVTTGLCFGTPMTEHLAQTGDGGDVPDGWYFGGYGYGYFIPGNPEIDAYLSVIQDYAEANGIENIEYTGFAGPTYGNALTLVKFMNEIGPDNVTPDAMRQAALAFTGPMYGVVGPMACGKNPLFPALCGTQMSIQQYKDGEWISINDGFNGKPIDPSAATS